MDRLIDDVARALTEPGEPAALRGPVLARIGRRRRRWPAWLAAPVTAAAAVVYAVAVRGPVTPSTIDPAVRAAATPSATAAAAVPGIAPLAAAPEPVHPRPTVRAAAPVAAIRTLPALDEPRPLTAEDIQPDPLAIPLLRMTPIVTEPIATKSSDDSGRRP